MNFKKSPTEALNQWKLGTLRHVFNWEYFVGELQLNPAGESERPHDIVGINNKFEPAMMDKFAITSSLEANSGFDNPLKNPLQYAIELHREQHHHRMWNEPSVSDLTRSVTGASEDMLAGAIDTICSLLENRLYSGGKHSLEEVRRILKDDKPHQAPYFEIVFSEMDKMESPRLDKITLDSVPNIGVPIPIYDAIIERFMEVEHYNGSN
jgi:hypothetical protein